MSKEPLKLKKQDEYYTPACLVKPILSFIKPNSIVWCPFDTDKSEYVLLLKEEGHTVIHSHISEGKDFFSYTPKTFDYIISNPPFSRKKEVLTRCYELQKPFALLLGLPILNYQEIGHFFLDKELQLLIFDKKVSFDGNTASFNSSYFCSQFLPKQLIFYHLENNNTKDNFKPSRMLLD